MSAVEMIDKYLYDLPTTMWGRGYDINDEGSRRKAAEWLKGQIEAVHSHGSGVRLQILSPEEAHDMATLHGQIENLIEENQRLQMELASRPVCP